MNQQQIELAIASMTHEQIRALRELLKKQGNENYLLRALYYDYSTQKWI